MTRLSFAFVLSLTACIVAAPALPAQDTDSAAIAELQAQVEAITRQLEAMQLGADVVPEADTGMYGFAPAASKIYRTRQGVSIGGYGEFLYERYASSPLLTVASRRIASHTSGSSSMDGYSAPPQLTALFSFSSS